MVDEVKILDDVPVKRPKPFGVCRKCKKVIERKLDSCRCRQYLCYNCCECHMDCDLCNCSHKKRNHYI